MSVTMESLAERLAEKGMISPKDGQSASGFGGEVDPDQSPSGETDRGQPAVGESQNPAQLKEGESPGPSDEGENPDGQEGQTSGESSTEVKIETIADLAGYLEVEPDFIYGLKIKLSESGEPVPLGEIKDKLQEYQRQAGDIEREKANLEAERQNWLQQFQQVQQYGGQLSGRGQQAPGPMGAPKGGVCRLNRGEATKTAEKVQHRQASTDRGAARTSTDAARNVPTIQSGTRPAAAGPGPGMARFRPRYEGHPRYLVLDAGAVPFYVRRNQPGG